MKIIYVITAMFVVSCSTLDTVKPVFRKPFSGGFKQNVPVRIYDDDGDPFYPWEIPIIHDKDHYNDGWRYDIDEWNDLKHGRSLGRPYYFEDPEHGSNNGIEIG
jgi:hypothetical protein